MAGITENWFLSPLRLLHQYELTGHIPTAVHRGYIGSWEIKMEEGNDNEKYDEINNNFGKNDNNNDNMILYLLRE